MRAVAWALHEGCRGISNLWFSFWFTNPEKGYPHKMTKLHAKQNNQKEPTYATNSERFQATFCYFSCMGPGPALLVGRCPRNAAPLHCG